MVERDCSNLSIARQCNLLLINKSTYYYKPHGLTEKELEIMKIIDEIYTEHPYFGARRMSKHLVPFGVNIGRKSVSHYYRIMAIEAYGLEEKWGKKYSMVIKSWQQNWDNLATYFKYSGEVRKLIYTSNPIEGFHRQVRKYTKAKGAFTSENALFKLVFLCYKTDYN